MAPHPKQQPEQGNATPKRKLRALGIVPARLGSTRMARKMLRDDTGACLFEHTVRNAERADSLDSVWLATDDAEILEAARAASIPALMTDSRHTSGTDRVHEATGILQERGEFGEADVIVNVQGDEPELPPEDIDRLVNAFQDPEVEIATLWCPIITESERVDSSAVKLVCDRSGRALYFSRSPIPADAHPEAGPDAQAPLGRRHVGIYAFRPAALARFCSLPEGELERTERLEQLRWLENGGSIHAIRASLAPRGIDTESDYRAFVDRLSASSKGPSSTASETPTRIS